MRTPSAHLPVVLAATAFLLAACEGGARCTPVSDDRVLSVGCQDTSAPLRLDRGDWMVSQGTEVWKVVEGPLEGPWFLKGYLVARDYRQMRGGPTYRIYTVTTMNRREEIGRIDQLGRAYRYVPQPNAGFIEVDEGVNTLENSVGAIFQTPRPVRLEKTSERRLAFELLDKDRDGLLQPEETLPHGDRLRQADVNRDGHVDFEEFDALDIL
jgi:hypothetical protein